MLVLLKLTRVDDDVGTALRWTFTGNHVVNLRWLIVIVRHVIVRVILVVKREVDSSDGDAIESCRGHARHFGRVDQPTWSLNVKIGEDAESVVSVVDDSLVDEGVHRATLEDDLIATFLGAVVRLELSQDRVTVVPV